MNRPHEEIAREREEIRQSILSSLRLIVQSQYILADLQENQKRLERLLDQLGETLTPKEKENGDTSQETVVPEADPSG